MSDPDPDMTVAVAPIDESLLSYTHVMYALHSLAVLIGVTTFHTIVGSFIGSLPSIVAVVMNYARRSATHGSFLESHFRWQLRTFWFAVRSEEHTSELQSQSNLVCRLLLAK